MDKNESFLDRLAIITGNRVKKTDEGINPHTVQGPHLIHHEYKDDPDILDQFSVSCNESLRACSTAIYVYRDRIDIRRWAACGNIVAPKRDSLSFDEIDNIVVKSNGAKVFIRFSGEIQISFNQGTRYHYLGTPEHMEKKDIKLTEANQILFDEEYNQLVDKHIEIIQEILRTYKKEVRFEEKQKEKKPENITYQTNSTVNFGDGPIYNNNYIDSHNIDIENSITNLYQQVQMESVGEEREEMLRILYEVEKLIKEIQQTGKMPETKKGRFEKAGDHFKKHEWFYGGIVTVIGNAVIKYMLGV